MDNSPNPGSRFPGDVRQNSFSGSNFGLNDPRNPRIDTIINSQAQQSSSSSAFDTSSPVSLDFNFPFAGSPHGSSNSGIDAPPELRVNQSQGFAPRNSISDMPRSSIHKMSGQQHRASLTSIDSAFDHDMLAGGGYNSWTPTGSQNQAVSNSDDSPRKMENSGRKDSKVTDDDDKPAWSELKTKAGKERKRLPLACIACRRKKIRCSGEKPACKHCLKARVPCVYKVTTRKAAPRTDYMAMLDKRLKRMEDRVIKVIPKEELPDMSTTGRASVRPPLPGQTPKKDKSAPGKKRSADEAFTQELGDWTRSRERATLLDQQSGIRKQRDGENKLFIEGSESLPPQHIQEHLAEVFFDCCYGQSYLLLHKPSFMRKLKAGTVPPVLILAVCAISARFSTHPQVSTEPAFLRGEQWATPARNIIEKRHYEPNITILIAMLMLGLHYFGTCEGGLSWSFGGQAMRMGYALQLHRELDHDPLGRNQIIGKSSDPSKPNVKPPELSFTDREIRRRTMWACYLMDTFNSSGTERPSFLNEDYFQIQLPIKESHFQIEVPGPTEDLHGDVPISRKHKDPENISSDTTSLADEAKSNMGVAAYVIRAVVLWKRIVKYLNLGGKEKDPHPIWDSLSQFSALQRTITALKASLPSTLTYTTDNLATHTSERLANQFLFLHIVLAQASLFLHRFAIPTYPSSRPHHHSFLAAGMPKSFLTTSAQTVIDSAATIAQLIDASTGHTLTVPFAGYCAYASATVHVWGIFSRSPSLEAASKENLRHNYKYLTRMKRHWGMFHYMAESVKDTYRAFADASLKQPPSLTSSAAATLLRQRSSSGAKGDALPSTGPNGSPLELSRAGTPTHTATNSTSSTKQMFQYGDWFDKYPHGVSESEWESSHLEYRKEGDQGTEAVMSQRSDLQSVEEFFASLSPPSKADDAVGGRGKKVARRRGKSVAENAGGGGNGVGKKGEQGQAQQNKVGGGQRGSISQPSTAAGPQAHRQSSASGPSGRPGSGSSIHRMGPATIANPFPAGTDFDMTSPTLYQTPQLPTGNAAFDASSTSALSAGFSPPTFPDISSNFTGFSSAVPHLDRRMVFGAYAGIDPQTINSSANINNPAQGHSNQNFNPSQSNPNAGAEAQNPWDQIDMYAGSANDSFWANPNDNNFGMGTHTAWMMPFNIEPPNFGGMGDDLGGGALDGMDFGDIGGVPGGEGDNSGGRIGSFSAASGGGQ